MGNPLRTFFATNKTGLMTQKWEHYLEVYHHHFQCYQGQAVQLLEIGVAHGGSMEMWKSYFGEQSQFYGIDINPACVHMADDQVQIFIGRQEDRTFLKQLKRQLPPLDIIIDDGGHEMQQQIISFEELFCSLKEGGIYICEDLHTSYWPEYGGGLHAPGSFISYSKQVVDYLNAWHSKDKDWRPNHWTRLIWSMSYYDSMLVIEKRRRTPPQKIYSGLPSLEYMKHMR